MNYVLRRLLIYAIVLFAVANLDFFLPRISVGNPAVVFALTSKFPAQTVREVTIRLGLDQPMYVQYVDYMRSLFATFPPYLGVSYTYYPLTVWDLFVAGIPWDFLLIGTSVVLALTIAYLGAASSVLRRGGKAEVSWLYSSILTQAIPGYWIAIVTLWIFAVWLKWVPLFGAGSGSGLDFASSVVYHLVLPMIVMAVATYGSYYLLLRGAVQETLRSDFVLAAKTRGLRQGVVARRYVLRNALLPLVSLLTFSFSHLISAAVVIETIFGYPGVGGLLVDFVNARDYPGLTGLLFLLTVVIVVIGFFGDLLLVRLDPRLR